MGETAMRVALALLAVVALVAVTLHADELQDLSSADVAPSVEAKEVSKPNKADLGEGVGNFGGALMTSGSFTMMASSSLDEEELGEGTGNFGGALMTSGSFTMMAS